MLDVTDVLDSVNVHWKAQGNPNLLIHCAWVNGYRSKHICTNCRPSFVTSQKARSVGPEAYIHSIYMRMQRQIGWPLLMARISKRRKASAGLDLCGYSTRAWQPICRLSVDKFRSFEARGQLRWLDGLHDGLLDAVGVALGTGASL